ncbi:MAG TPA: hypothetical protein VFW79_05465 [Cellulomonas sp.]|uniref:hypothetical protein n=1 Tax=Cellulomonas sp. TaxID=40001 RepID=UPI002E3401B4|nr:hypothetical protein [Cellulomonas sp.]HEX5332074.1 hypothetical protein [Cellulomonas sp.]
MSKSTNRRKSIAIALAVLGVAGLSLASAAQLNLTGTASVQSGILAVNADCQSAPITVTFSAPVRTGTTYASAAVNLAGIDNAVGKCVGKNYKLALLDSGNALVTGTTEQTGTIAASTLSVVIPSGQDNAIKTVALTIYS